MRAGRARGPHGQRLRGRYAGQRQLYPPATTFWSIRSASTIYEPQRPDDRRIQAEDGSGLTVVETNSADVLSELGDRDARHLVFPLDAQRVRHRGRLPRTVITPSAQMIDTQDYTAIQTRRHSTRPSIATTRWAAKGGHGPVGRHHARPSTTSAGWRRASTWAPATARLWPGGVFRPPPRTWWRSPSNQYDGGSGGRRRPADRDHAVRR